MTEPEPIEMLLSDVTRLFWQELEAALRASGLDFTAGEARALINIAKADGLKQSLLAERLRIEPMTLVGMVDRLEARGLIERVADPTDRRAKLVRTTAAAPATIARIKAAAAPVKAEVRSGLGDDEVELLRAVLLRIRDNLTRTHASARMEP